ncbi:MAG: hypothetical protein KA243_06310 [Candidatus Aminicenantes bacterium]|nr:hypothetical protein [Candidatus Aminicenantes bacterium]
MRTAVTGRFAAPLLVATLLVQAPGLGAQERQGAGILITLKDGSQVRGELIAVRPDSLLLLGPGEKDVSVALADIWRVRIVRRAPTGLLTLSGFLLSSGLVGMSTEPDIEFGWAGAAGAGVLGGVEGLVYGMVSSKDRSLSSWGGPADASRRDLDRLKGLSRESRLRGRSGSAARSRFRIALATTMGPFVGERYRPLEATWRFTEDPPPEEALPQVTEYYLNYAPELASPAPLSLGYEWTERWVSEIELSLWGRDMEARANTYPFFISTTDYRTYQAYVSDRLRVGYDYVLVGLAYRPTVPSLGRRAAVEIGISAGPAWVKAEPDEPAIPAEKKTVPAVRIRAAYDHYFTPSFFLGVYGGYRYSEASFAPATVTRELTFHDRDNWEDPAEPITRQVEMTLPAREFSWSGVVYGLRIGFRI